MFGHWDVEISNEKTTCKIDIKSRKRISRSSITFQDDLIWIEIHGPVNKGWLYSSEAKFIAFEREDCFVIVNRNNLIMVVEKLVDISSIVARASDALYKIYNRRDKEMLTLIKYDDITSITNNTWKK